MKKVLSVLLIVCIVASLGACGTENSGTKAKTFRVGYGRRVILPEESVPIAGMGNSSERMSTGYLDEIMTSCVAIADKDDNTVLLFSNDLVASYTEAFSGIINAIAKETKIPIKNIQVSCTHTHAGPDISNMAEPSIVRYNVQLKDWMIEAAKEALADLKPAEIEVGSVKTESLNFVRRYILVDGSEADDMTTWSTAPEIAKHESEVDSTLQLIKFTRKGTSDVIMANFQEHPHRGQSQTDLNISANIVSVLRDNMESKLGCKLIYFSGASGNVNGFSRVKSENIYADYKEEANVLTDYALGIKYKKVKTGKVGVSEKQMQLYHDVPTKELVEVAKKFQSVYNSTGKNDMAAAAVNNEVIHIQQAKMLVTKENFSESRVIAINAVSAGDVAFVAAPYEMFCANGVQIKEKSPFEMTFVLTQANKAYGYVPDYDSFVNGGYETWKTLFRRGSAEELVDGFLSMLKQLHK